MSKYQQALIYKAKEQVVSFLGKFISGKQNELEAVTTTVPT